MKKHLLLGLAATVIVTGGVFIFIKSSSHSNKGSFLEAKEENEEKEMSYVEARARYEFDMIKDPATGKIPAGIFEQELAVAKTLPEKNYGSTATARVQDLNSYNPAGPNNIGGRTRALVYDSRYNGATNMVIMAGCVSGGI